MRLKTIGVLAAAPLSLLLATRSTQAGDKPFHLSTIKGSYASTFRGKTKSGAQLLRFDGTGVFIADGKGHLSGHETYTVGDHVCEAMIDGTYTVNGDGTGTDAIHFTATKPGCTDGSYTQSLVVADSGNLILLSNTNGDHVSEQWHLQK